MLWRYSVLPAKKDVSDHTYALTVSNQPSPDDHGHFRSLDGDLPCPLVPLHFHLWVRRPRQDHRGRIRLRSHDGEPTADLPHRINLAHPGVGRAKVNKAWAYFCPGASTTSTPHLAVSLDFSNNSRRDINGTRFGLGFFLHFLIGHGKLHLLWKNHFKKATKL